MEIPIDTKQVYQEAEDTLFNQKLTREITLEEYTDAMILVGDWKQHEEDNVFQEHLFNP
jgi:hypothetical protein